MLGSDKLWGAVLQLQAPWVVRDVQLNETARKINVHIGVEQHRSWFGLSRRGSVEETEKSWRHLNVEGWECHIHVFLPAGTPDVRHPWAGEHDSPFTRAMSRHIFNMMREGVKLDSIAKVLGVQFTDLWKFKFALDHGTTAVSSAQVATEVKSNEDSMVPAADAPVWQSLVAGDFDGEIRVLSLKLLLSKLRTQLGSINDEEVRTLKMEELQRFFVKNQRVLTHELGLIRKQ